jgi:flagellar basal body-associated protein FliL
MPGVEKEAEFVSQEEIDRLLGDEDAPESKAIPEQSENRASLKSHAGQEAPAEIPLADAPAGKDADESAKTFADRVVLEEVPRETIARTPVCRNRWSPGKEFWIAASMAVIFGTAVNAFLWANSREIRHPGKPEILTFPVVNIPDAQLPASLRISPLSFDLKGFLVSAPADRKDLTYITVDVSVELTNAKAVSLVKAHTAFYRNIIYEAIRGLLKSIDKANFNEISLKLEILKAVNRSFPERAVRDIVVDALVVY